MRATEKLWGTTTALLRTPMVEMHRIEVRPDMRCSTHVHRHKWNAFLVLSGVLTIEGEALLAEPLRAGDFTTVKPGIWHRFVTGPEGAVAVEVYYPEPVSLSEDIIRRDIGGMRNQE